jgi:hypothetical protein
MLERCFRRAAVLLALGCGYVFAAEAPSFEMAGRTVRLGLVNSSDRALTAWPSGKAQLSAETISVTPDTNIPEQIAARGIMPDSGAFSLLYDLNPGLKLDALAAGTTVAIPVVNAGPELKQSLADGSHYVILIVDPELRVQLADAIGELEEVTSRASPIANSSAVSNQIEDVSAWFSHIRKTQQMRKGPPASRDTLATLVDEARALTAVIRSAAGRSRQVDEDDARQIAAIHDDLEREIKRYDDVMGGGVPESEPARCCVIEAAVLGADAGTLEKVRVYYTLEGLFSANRPPTRVSAFLSFGSASSEPLRAKSYRVWVSLDGSPNERLTNGALAVDLRGAQPLTKIQLRLAQPSRAQ